MILLNTSDGDIQLDATLREDTETNSTLTSHPIEFGAVISDHVFDNPKTYVVEGGVTDTPMGFVGDDPAGDSFSGSNATRSQAAWELLQRIKAAGDVFDVQTGLELIEDVVLISLVNSREAATSKALFVRMTLQQVILTDTLETFLTSEQLADAVKAQGQSNVERGQIQKEEVTNQSWLLQLAQHLEFVPE